MQPFVAENQCVSQLFLVAQRENDFTYALIWSVFETREYGSDFWLTNIISKALSRFNLGLKNYRAINTLCSSASSTWQIKQPTAQATKNISIYLAFRSDALSSINNINACTNIIQLQHRVLVANQNHWVKSTHKGFCVLSRVRVLCIAQMSWV
ncbi:Hypothetical_protein [Hexamita inflata]|nr:Hypothetical protein HINF_LOCUS56409 [Hexamita inflata]